MITMNFIKRERWLLTFAVATLLILLYVYHKVGLTILTLTNENYIVPTVIILFFCALFVPPVLDFARAAREGKDEQRDASLLHLLPYVILLLALFSSGLPEHAAEKMKSSAQGTKAGAPVLSDEDVFHITKEMAAILVLFTLAEMSAFIYGWLAELSVEARETTKQIKHAQDGLKTAQGHMETAKKVLESASDLSRLHPDITDTFNKLIKEYSNIVPARFDEPVTDTDVCLRTLARQYLLEELRDIQAQLISSHEIPHSVNVRLMLEEQFNPKDVNYFATNVGFYAKLLTQIVDQLKSQDMKLSMAVLTNVLPPHWWDWPMEEDCWYAYTPVEGYRAAQTSAIEKGARIDRIILIGKENSNDKQTKNTDKVGALWSTTLAEKVKNWQILVPEQRYSLYTHSQIVNDTIPYIKNLLDNRSLIPQRTYFNPIFEQPRQGTISLINHYVSVMHGKAGGHSWYIPVDDPNFQDRSNGFGGCNDIVFIGRFSSPEDKSAESVWFNDATPSWAVGFLASMNPGSETMFLTAVHGETLNALWERFKGAVKSRQSEAIQIEATSPVSAYQS
jgi:hypothetical protein